MKTRPSSLSAARSPVRTHLRPVTIVFLPLIVAGLWLLGMPGSSHQHVALAQTGTVVSGGIFTNTTWYAAQSPYIVTANVVVFPNVTLNVEPGVQIQVADGQSLEIRGTLQSVGSAANPILFTSNNPNPTPGVWTGISLTLASNGAANLAYTTVSYAQQGIGIVPPPCCPGNLTIANSTFSHNVTGVYAGTQSVIEHTLFDSNVTGLDGWALRVSNSTFQNNQTGSNIVAGLFYADTFTGNNLAIARGDQVQVQYCLITGNGTGINAPSGVSVTTSTITNNNIGVVVSTGNGGPTNISNSNVFSNTTYNMQTTTSTNTSQPNNWWGTTDTAVIDAGIFDGYDNSSLGLILYQPILAQAVDITPPPPPPTATAIPPTDTATVTPTPALASVTPTTTPTSAPGLATTTSTPSATSIYTATPTRTAVLSTGTATATPPQPTASVTATPTTLRSATPTPSATITLSPTITPTPIIGLPPGFHAEYACRNGGDGTLRDTGVSGNAPPPACHSGWNLIEILISP